MIHMYLVDGFNIYAKQNLGNQKNYDILVSV